MTAFYRAVKKMKVFKKDVTSKQLVGIDLFSVNTRKGNIPKKIILKFQSYWKIFLLFFFHRNEKCTANKL